MLISKKAFQESLYASELHRWAPGVLVRPVCLDQRRQYYRSLTDLWLPGSSGHSVHACLLCNDCLCSDQAASAFWRAALRQSTLYVCGLPYSQLCAIKQAVLPLCKVPLLGLKDVNGKPAAFFKTGCMNSL